MAGTGGSSKVAKRPTAKAATPPAVPEPFTPGFFAAVNQGPLERAYEERQRDPRTWNRIPWGLVAVGVLIGLVFSYVNIYAALAAGITVGGSWYLTYFIGIVARWRPGVINYVAGASTGASQVVIGAAFVVPALFFLSDRGQLPTAFGFTPLYAFDTLPSPFALAGFFVVGGLLGVLFFQFYRRVWVVERPLQYPGGFESTMELLAIADKQQAGDRQAARDSIFVVTLSALVAAFFVFLRDLRAFGPSGNRRSFLDDLFAGDVYREGIMPDPWIYRPFYNGLFYADPFFLAIGWFVRMRIAGVLLAGALVSTVLVFFDPGAYTDPRNDVLGAGYGLAASWAGTARTLAAGVILGAGLVAMFRLRNVIGSGLRSVFSPREGVGARVLPVWVTWGLVAGGGVLSVVLLVVGGVPWAGALLVVPLGILLIAVLGIVAVKVTGETAVQAVSPMTVITLLLLLLVLQFTGFSTATLAVVALGAAAFFATGLVMSTDIFLDSKVALYVGNPPHRQAMVQMAGLVPGILVGTAAVWFLTGQIMDDTFTTFRVPIGAALARLTEAFTGGEINWALFALAVGLGVAVEFATGLGTAFGIGMALSLFAPFTIFVGALLRTAYERFVAPTVHGGSPALQALTRIAMPTGVFVGASLAALLVFVLNQFVF